MNRFIKIIFIIVLFSPFCAKPEDFGSISITSTPTGARVYLDGNYTGKETNCTLDSILPGKHTIKLTKAGYEDYEEEIMVESGKEVEVSATLRERGWMQTFGGNESDGGYSVKQTFDGGYIIAGWTTSYGEKDIWLIKTDKDGNKEWDRTFGWGNDEYGYSVEQTSDGGYIITGHTYFYGTTGYDVVLIKTDGDGNKEWDIIFGGSGNEQGYSVEQTSDGGYIIAGWTTSYGAGGSDIWLIKVDGDGNKEWDMTFGGSNWDKGYSIQQTLDGGYIITGYTESYGAGGSDIWLIKTDKDGNKEWDRTFGGGSWDVGHSVEQTSDGGYIITGYTESYGAGGSDIWLIKTDKDGNKEWDMTFGGDGWDVGKSVEQTSDGGYIIAGWTTSYGAGEKDIWLIKVDGNGNKEWNRTFGGDNDEYGYSVEQTSDGGYILTGMTQSYGEGNEDVWLIKTDENGNVE